MALGTYHLADNVAELAPFVVWGLTAGKFPLAIRVVQVLALDIGTDVFPALALGAEPPDSRALNGPPVRGHLLDRGLMIRAFAVLGFVEAAVALTAFVVSLHAQGWRPGQEFPTGPALLAASGAAFTAIVLGQVANAFACRSVDRPSWATDIRTNPLLIAAILAELGLLLALLYVPPVAHLLGHAGRRSPDSQWRHWRFRLFCWRTRSTSVSDAAVAGTYGSSPYGGVRAG